MNYTKIGYKALLATLLAIGTDSQINAVPQTQKESLLNSIKTYKNSIGSKDVMENTTDLSSWDTIMTSVATFINTYGKDGKLLAGLDTLQALSKNLIRSIQDTRAAMKLGQVTGDAESQIKQNFANYQKSALDAKNSIGKLTFVIQDKKDVRDILLQLATALQASTVSSAAAFRTKNVSLKPYKPALSFTPATAQKKSNQPTNAAQSKATTTQPQKQSQTNDFPAAALSGAAKQIRGAGEASKGFMIRKK